MKDAPEWRLALCGFGLDTLQITLETLEALRRSDVIFTDALDATTMAFLRECCADVRDLKALTGGSDSKEDMERKVEAVLAAVEGGSRAALLNYGHATFLSSLSQALIEGCRKRSIPWRAYNSVSSLDAALASLGLSVIWSGLHVYDADLFMGLIKLLPLQPAVPTLVVKIGYLLKPEQSRRLRPLLEHLRRYYPADHPCVLLESPWLGNPSGRRIEVPLGSLDGSIEGPNEFLTLFLPPVGAPDPAARREDRLPEDVREGWRLLSSGGAPEAAAHFSRLLEREPGRLDALEWRASSLLAARRPKEALRDLDEAVRLAPAPGWRHGLRAEARLRAGDPEGCLSDLGAAADWESHDRHRCLVLGALALAALERFGEAEERAQRAIDAGGLMDTVSALTSLDDCLSRACQKRLAEHARRRLGERPDRAWLQAFADL